MEEVGKLLEWTHHPAEEYQTSQAAHSDTTHTPLPTFTLQQTTGVHLDLPDAIVRDVTSTTGIGQSLAIDGGMDTIARYG